MISWKWKVRTLTLRPSLNTLQNVVATVHWSIVIIENDLETSINEGYTYLTPPADGSEFIAYDTLTEEQCIDWVKQILGPSVTATYVAEAEHRVLFKQGINAVNTNTFPWSTTGG